MSKKQQIDVLCKDLEETIRQFVLNEVAYRTFTALAMSSPKDDQMNAQQTQAHKMKKALECKIRSARGLIKEIEDGTFTV